MLIVLQSHSKGQEYDLILGFLIWLSITWSGKKCHPKILLLCNGPDVFARRSFLQHQRRMKRLRLMVMLVAGYPPQLVIVFVELRPRDNAFSISRHQEQPEDAPSMLRAEEQTRPAVYVAGPPPTSRVRPDGQQSAWQKMRPTGYPPLSKYARTPFR